VAPSRLAAATELIEGVGGKIESFYFAFGGTDAFVVADLPDEVSAMAGRADGRRRGGRHDPYRLALDASAGGCGLRTRRK